MDKAKFLAECAGTTKSYHAPLVDTQRGTALEQTGGKLNPRCLDYPNNLHQALLGTTSLVPAQLLAQSSRGFDTVAEYRTMDSGPSLYRAEYGVTGTEESVALAKEVNRRYGGEGTSIVASGATAINAAIGSLMWRLVRDGMGHEHSILLPENVYYPVRRFLETGTRVSSDQIIYYKAGNENFAEAIAESHRRKKAPTIIYIETPVSNLFETHDIQFLVEQVKKLEAFTIMDNTFSTFLGCKPNVEFDVDIVIDAGTKYLGGYGDCCYGAIVSKSEALAELVSSYIRAEMIGTVAPGLARLALHRLETADQRMQQSYEAACMLRSEIFEPMLREEVDQILVYDPKMADRRIAGQTTRGNGLFTVVLNPEKVSSHQRDRLVDENPLVIPAASWGGHLTLATTFEVNGKPAIRFHAGMEDRDDLHRAFQTTVRQVLCP